MDYFLAEFGLNPIEVTALMEAHTLLGQANILILDTMDPG